MFTTVTGPVCERCGSLLIPDDKCVNGCSLADRIASLRARLSAAEGERDRLKASEEAAWREIHVQAARNQRLVEDLHALKAVKNARSAAKVKVIDGTLLETASGVNSTVLGPVKLGLPPANDGTLIVSVGPEGPQERGGQARRLQTCRW